VRSILAPEPEGPVETVGEAGSLSAASALADYCHADVVARPVACLRVEQFVVRRPGTVVAVSFTMLGELTGPLVVLFAADAASRLAGRSLDDPEQVGFPLSPLAEEVLVEIAKVVADAYVDGVTSTMDDSVTLAIPDLRIGPGAEVLPEMLKGVHLNRIILAPLVVDGCELVIVHGI
jgi:chemotaxis protein CheY-P-specific phosphatase CheC